MTLKPELRFYYIFDMALKT